MHAPGHKQLNSVSQPHPTQPSQMTHEHTFMAVAARASAESTRYGCGEAALHLLLSVQLDSFIGCQAFKVLGMHLRLDLVKG